MYARIKDAKLASIDPFALLQFEDGPGGGNGPGGGGFGGGAGGGTGGGGFGGGLGNMVTSDLGNKITTLSIVGWESRGGMGIHQSLTHNSLDNGDSDFGHGWNHTYGARISHTPGSSAILRTSTGLEVPFSETPTGTFTPPAGIHDALVRNANGTFTLTGKDQSVGEFNAAGYVVTIRDRYQNQVTINRDAANHITTVVDPTGKALTFAYTSEGHVSSVTDPTSRQWQFAYSSSGDLVSITYPLPKGLSSSFSTELVLMRGRRPKGKRLLWACDFQTSGFTPGTAPSSMLRSNPAEQSTGDCKWKRTHFLKSPHLLYGYHR